MATGKRSKTSRCGDCLSKPCACAERLMQFLQSPDVELELEKPLGSGSYGVVYAAKAGKDRNKCAVKISNVSGFNDIDLRRVVRELAILNALRAALMVLPDVPNDPFAYHSFIRIANAFSTIRPATDELTCAVGSEEGAQLSAGAQVPPVIVIVSSLHDADLHQVLRTDCGITEEHIICIMWGLVGALETLHALGIVHGDIKPSNILLDKNGKAYLCDFNLSHRWGHLPPDEAWQPIGTLWWRSPENILGLPAGEPIDVWALGCVFAELLRILHPDGPVRGALFYTAIPVKGPDAPNENIRQLDKIISVLGTPGEGLQKKLGALPHYVSAWAAAPRPSELRGMFQGCGDPAALDLLEWMLAFDSADRPTPRQILLHPYFAHFKKQLESLSAPTALPTALPKDVVLRTVRAALESDLQSIDGCATRDALNCKLSEQIKITQSL